jgi:hypothetical protein
VCVPAPQSEWNENAAYLSKNSDVAQPFASTRAPTRFGAARTGLTEPVDELCFGIKGVEQHFHSILSALLFHSSAQGLRYIWPVRRQFVDEVLRGLYDGA